MVIGETTTPLQIGPRVRAEFRAPSARAGMPLQANAARHEGAGAVEGVSESNTKHERDGQEMHTT